MHRARVLPRWRALANRHAERAGRIVGSALRTVPGAGGALLLCFGLGQVYGPLLFIAGGAFLLLLDRRIP